MTKDKFYNTVLVPRLEEIICLFQAKSAEYASEENIFKNFTEGGRMDNISPQQCLWDYMRKHLVSIKDMIDNPDKCSPDQAKEKIGDVILYMITLQGMIIKE